MIELDGPQKTIVETLDRPLFVEAGAGSGKTFTLVQRLAHALEPDPATGVAPLSSIENALVITFTKRAAAEIRERVRAELVACGLHDEALAVDRAWISTIHGMCERILRSSALELGLDPAFKVIADNEEQYLRSRAVSEVLLEVRGDPRYAELFSVFGDSFDAASESGVAQRGRSFGGGRSAPEMAEVLTGKANASPEGFAALAFKGEAPDFVALGTRAKEAVDALVDGWQPKPGTKGEGHRADLARFAEELGAWVAAGAPFEAWGELEAAIVVPDGRLAGKTVTELRCDAQEALAGLVMEAAYEPVRRLQEPLLDLARAIDERYRAVKREQGALDNGDLLRLALKGLSEHPVVKQRFQGTFELVMIDEFQDTDSQQFGIVSLLAPNADRLCFVGDRQQSIYRFRGADVEQYDRARDEATTIVRMDRNFRSHDDILRFVSRALGDSEILPGFMDLEAFDGRSDGYAGVDMPRIMVEHTQAAAAPKGLRQVSKDALVAQNAEQVANRLQELARQGVRPGDMALLLRGLNHVEPYLHALRDHGLEAVVAGGSSFASAPEVQQVQALLWALANPRDTQRGLLPVLQGPIFALDDDDLVLLARGGSSAGLVEGLLAGPKDAERVLGEKPGPRLAQALKVMESARRRMGYTGVADTVLAVCTESGWLARLEREGVSGRARAANVLSAIRHVRRLADDAGLGFSRAPKVFADWLSSAKEGPGALSGEETDAVRVMTVHASKGLEFPVVAVAGVFDEPHNQGREGLVTSREGAEVRLALRPVAEKGSVADKLKKFYVPPACPRTALSWRAHLEECETDAEVRESARLLYVALTRAREALVVGITTKLSTSGDVRPPMAESFLEALWGDVPTLQGTVPIDYGGEQEGRLVTVVAEPAAPEPDNAEDVTEPVEEERPDFPLFDEARTAPPAMAWSAREDVRSYSKDFHQAQMAAALDAEEDATEVPGSEPGNDVAGEPSWDAPSAFDDEAVRFGDAFHELARLAAGDGVLPDRARVAAVAARRSLGVDAEDRLGRALAAWWATPLRQRALSAATVVPELPFFSAQDGGASGYVTGSIDLFSSNGDGRALVVDYKTGETYLDAAAAAEHHEMQARYYAHVLMEQGYRQVEVAFVLVENVRDGGEPLTVSFDFEGEVPPLGV
ncbi:UvrD-helicase domain-containing protein [Atopobiaceae bacterium 24-176]